MAEKKSGAGFKVAVAAGVLFALAGQSGHHHGGGILADLTSFGGGGGSAGCRKLERLWTAAGGDPAQAQTAASVAMAESSGQQYSTDYDSNGTVDRGYWQINSIWGAQSTFDPMGNARAAVAISHDGTNWTPWTTYNTGTYAGRC